MSIQEKLILLPTNPGVYLMRNEKGRVIYVGKARNLRQRVRSYFRSSATQSPKVQVLVQHIADFEYIVTDTETEALVLESNLIKKHRPKYNVSIKDDKHYPYIKITMQELYPRLLIARQVQKDGARYYGPYPDASAARESIKLLRQIFKLRSCKKKLTGQPEGRVCLNHHIKLCSAPCQSRISVEQYGQSIAMVRRFLEGKQEELAADIRDSMEKAAQALNFERAARLRNQLQAIEQVLAKQKVISTDLEDRDILALARGVQDTCVSVFSMRGGRLLGRDNFFMIANSDNSDSEILTAFVKLHYAQRAYVPKEIHVDVPLEETEVIETFLSEKRDARVYVKHPQRGEKKRLCEMVRKNAQLAIEEKWAQHQDRQQILAQACHGLAQALRLREVPERIECYDISNIQGSLAVGSMVVFQGGEAHKPHYRRFKIQSTEGPDDYAMLQEVINRRLARLQSEDESFREKPDLIIIDGGKGQVNAVWEILKQRGYQDIAVVGLAKKEEHLFLPFSSTPVVLSPNTQSLYLVQRIRDEAHRFAIEYHRRLRSRQQVQSELEMIKGIGAERRRQLFKAFGSLDKIKKASLAELQGVSGMNKASAENLYNYFRNPRH